MGLFNKANNLLTNENLHGENQFSEEKKFSPVKNIAKNNELFTFSDFIKKYNISSFAICQLIGDFFVIKDSLGFDGKTISHFLLSATDCNLIFSENKNIAVININNFDFLLNIFSDNQKQNNLEFSFCKISNNYLMICNCEITNDLLNSFSTVNNQHNIDFDLIKKNVSLNYNVYAVKIDFQEAIETFLCSCPHLKIEKNILFLSIFAEIYNRFLFCYNFPYFCKQNENYILKSCFFTKEEIPEELLINHIIYNLKDVLENSAEIINITAEKTKNFSEIQDFYRAE